MCLLNPLNYDLTSNKQLRRLKTYADLRDPFNSSICGSSDLVNNGVRGPTLEVIVSDPVSHHLSHLSIVQAHNSLNNCEYR